MYIHVCMCVCRGMEHSLGLELLSPAFPSPWAQPLRAEEGNAERGLLKAEGNHAYEWVLPGPNFFPLPTTVHINAPALTD